MKLIHKQDEKSQATQNMYKAYNVKFVSKKISRKISFCRREQSRIVCPNREEKFI